MVDFSLGVATTLAVAIHEIPQEIGDYGVLVHAGFNSKKALTLNYVVALTVVLGGVVGYFSFRNWKIFCRTFCLLRPEDLCISPLPT